MLEITLSGVLWAVFMTAPATPYPVTYTATNPAGIVLGYSQTAGWMSADQCNGNCRTLPGQPVPLLQGELTLAALAGEDVTIRRDGVPVAWFYRFFGGVPVYSVRPGD